MRSSTSWLLGVGLVAGLATPVRAQAMQDFALELQAPDDVVCTPAKQLQAAIEARVGGLVFLDSGEPGRRIQVRVSHDAAMEHWSAEITMRDDAARVVGERRVTARGETCNSLDEALVVVITTLIGVADPERPAAAPAAALLQPSVTAQPTSPVAEPQRDRPAAPPGALPTITHAQDAAEQPASRTVVSLSAAVRGDTGFMPGFAFAGALGLGIDFGTVAIGAGLAAFPHASSDLGGDASADVVGLLGDASLCVQAASFGATLDFCLGAQAGALRLDVQGLYAPAQSWEPVVRAVIGPRLRIPVASRLGVLVGLDAAFPLYSPRFYYVDADGDRTYYHSVGLGVSAQLGMYFDLSS
jgi:hypothetical protein